VVIWNRTQRQGIRRVRESYESKFTVTQKNKKIDVLEDVEAKTKEGL
jgi:hypothetical protein